MEDLLANTFEVNATPDLFLNESSSTTTAAESGPGQMDPLVSHDVVRWVNRVMNLLWLLIVIPGLWANATVVRVFRQMGLTDSTRVSLFSLAVADLLTLTGPSVSLVVAMLAWTEEQRLLTFDFQLAGIAIYVTVFATGANVVSNLLTTFLAGQRALCILRPFQFREMLSTRKTWVFVAVTSVVSVSISAIYASTYWYDLAVVNPATNATKHVIVIAPHFDDVHHISLIFNDVVVFLASQVWVSAAVVIMANGLKKSRRFREENKAATGKNCAAQHNISKERNTIMQITLVSAFFLVFNMPRFIMAFGLLIEPNFTFYGKYANILFLYSDVRMTFQYLNTLVNFPIYYKYNSKFRETLSREKTKPK